MMMGSQNLSLSGVLTTTAGSSPVTSATRTIRGFGKFLFGAVTSDGGTPEYQLNGGSWTSITEAMLLSIGGGDTLAVRAALITPGFDASFNLRQTFDGTTGSLIETVVLTRS